MGLIKAALGAAGGVLADQWKEYFYCEAMDAGTLVVKASHRTSGRSSNTKGSDNVISNGSVVAVADGQCMIIVDQGKIAELCAEPGEFTYDASSEPSIFSGKLGASILETFKEIGRRFTFGGEAPKDQRVYYINTKEITGNKYGTPNPVPFRVVDRNIGLDVDISVRCNGEYSYRLADPILFYTNVCGNVADRYDRGQIDSMLKSEFLTALQPAFARISELGIRYSALPGHALELSDALNSVLSKKWKETRGIQIVSVGVNSVTASPEDEKMIKDLQRNAVFANPNMAAAQLVGAQAQAMQDAAKNTATGPMMAFAGMNMAQQAGGMNAQALFQMGQQAPLGQGQGQAPAPAPQARPQAQAAQAAQAPAGAAGAAAAGAAAAGAAAAGWTCSCGAVNKGKFCTECGKPKPAGAPLYKCDKCGWEPQDPRNPPRFCPECGDPFTDADIQQ